jgi:hypothetical protein
MKKVINYLPLWVRILLCVIVDSVLASICAEVINNDVNAVLQVIIITCIMFVMVQVLAHAVKLTINLLKEKGL